MLAAAWYDLLRKFIIQSLRQKKTICSARYLEHLFCVTECKSMHVEKLVHST